MNNPYQITFTLRQHTPLIHFQHDQQGATLRATELKPKIDRFIREELKVVDKDLFNCYKSLIERYFLVDSENKICSPFKIHIQSKMDRKVFLFTNLSQGDTKLISSHPKAEKIAGKNFDIAYQTPLFVNNHLIKFKGKWKNRDREIRNDSQWEKLQLGIWLKDVSVTVTSLNPDITELISKCLPYVFTKENFGLRQSKGFGSFTIKNQSNNYLKALLKSENISCIYYKELQGNWKEKLENVLTFWKSIKAGNSHGGYYKSDLMKYFCKYQGIRWEKRIIKKTIHNSYPDVWNSLRKKTRINRIAGCETNNNNPEIIKTDSEEYKYIRGLLGLAQHNEYGVIDRKNHAIVNIKNGENEIERFKSPITFKIIDNKIYLICYKIPSQLYSKDEKKRKYIFKLEAKINNIPYNNVLTELEIPDNFDICEFLDSPWLGVNFEKASEWNNPNAKTIAQNFGYKKLEEL